MIQVSIMEPLAILICLIYWHIFVKYVKFLSFVTDFSRGKISWGRYMIDNEILGGKKLYHTHKTKSKLYMHKASPNIT